MSFSIGSVGGEGVDARAALELWDEIKREIDFAATEARIEDLTLDCAPRLGRFVA